MIVDSGTNALAAAVVDALRTVSIKNLTVYSCCRHKGSYPSPNVVEMAGLWGRKNEINNLSGREDGITGRTFLDKFRYCLKHSTGQSFLSWSKRAKNSSASLSSLPVFLGTVSLKDIPCGRTLQCLRTREAKAEIRSGQVNDLIH